MVLYCDKTATAICNRAYFYRSLVAFERLPRDDENTQAHVGRGIVGAFKRWSLDRFFLCHLCTVTQSTAHSYIQKGKSYAELMARWSRARSTPRNSVARSCASSGISRSRTINKINDRVDCVDRRPTAIVCASRLQCLQCATPKNKR